MATREITYRVPTMHPGQRIVYTDKHRLKILNAGRRWRKTSFGMRYGLRAAAVAGWPVLWGAPTFRQCRIGWDELRKAAGGIGDFHKGNMEVMLPPANGVISYVSLDDPDNCRGKSPRLIIIDEAPRIQGSAWHDVLRPMLSDNEGEALLMGTPNGRNWFWRLFIEAANRSDAIAWQVPTLGVRIDDTTNTLLREPHSMENPDFSFEEAQTLFHILPQDTFRQEFLAAFLEKTGAVFRNIPACMKAPRGARPEDHVDVTKDGDKEKRTPHYMVAGIDWGKKQDFTAISVCCRDCMVEVAKDRFNQIDYHVQRGRLVSLAKKWGVSLIVPESNSMGEPIIDELKRDDALKNVRIEPFETTSTSKPQLIENLALSFERGEVQWLADPIWQAELEAYEVQYSPQTGRPRYGAPEGVHDDTVMARALARRAMQKRKFMIGFA